MQASMPAAFWMVLKQPCGLLPQWLLYRAPRCLASIRLYHGWMDGAAHASGRNLIQGQRDYFGAHTFERTDKSGHFHFDWNAKAQ